VRLDFFVGLLMGMGVADETDLSGSATERNSSNGKIEWNS
jgi:hypothetical protein